MTRIFLCLQGVVLIGSVPLGFFLYAPGLLRYEPFFDAARDWAAVSLVSAILNLALASAALGGASAVAAWRTSISDVAASKCAMNVALGVLAALVLLPYANYLAHRVMAHMAAYPTAVTLLQILATSAGALVLTIPVSAIFAYWLQRQGTEAIFDRLSRLGIVLTVASAAAIPILVAGLFGPETPSRPVSIPRSPNIVLVTLDALSANAMSLYGAPRPTTPMLDRFAKRGVVVDRVISASNFTTPGLSTLMSGLDVDEHGNNELGSYFIPHGGLSTRDFLPARLWAAGYDTSAVIANLGGYPPRLRIGEYFDHSDLVGSVCDPLADGLAEAPSLNLSFGTVLFPHLASALGLFDFATCAWRDETAAPASLAYARALKWIDKGWNRKRPMFLWVHTFQPHAPYAPPPPYKKFFNASGRWTGLFPYAIGLVPAYQPAAAGSPEIRLLRDRYAENIRYADAELGSFLARLDARGLLRNTIVVVSSDHGETFDRWVTHDGPFLNQDLIGVPLVIEGPGIPAGIRLRGFAAQKDIPPTILDMAGVAVPSAMTGESLLGWIRRGEPAPDEPVYSMRVQSSRWSGPIRGGTFALIEGGLKYVQYFDLGKEELYDLSRDPRETHDLSQLRPDDLLRMRTELDRHLAARKPPYKPKSGRARL